MPSPFPPGFATELPGARISDTQIRITNAIPFHSDFLLASVTANIRERIPRDAINPDIVWLSLERTLPQVDSCVAEAMEDRIDTDVILSIDNPYYLLVFNY